MPKLTDIPPLRRIHALIVAPSGAGKTEFAGTWPRPAFLDTDFGIATLQNKGFRDRHPDVKLDEILVAQFRDEVDEHGKFKKAKAFWKVVRQFNEWATDPNVDTLVFDSLTSLSVLGMHVGLEVNKATGRSKTLKQRHGGHDILLQTQADYGSEMNVVEQVLDQLKQFDKHILVLAHERAEMNDAGGIVRIDPLITGARLRGKIAYWFDEAWYIEVKGVDDKKHRELTTDSTNKLKFAKSRIGVPDGMDNPTYAKIIKAIGGESALARKLEKIAEEDRAAVMSHQQRQQAARRS